MSTNRRPPGPRGHRLIGSLPEVRKDALGFLSDCARQYGDVVQYRILNTPAYLLNRPDLIEEVLIHQYRNFVKGRIYGATRQSFGEGLLTSEGEAWQKQRLLVQPAFHHERIAAYADLAVMETCQLMQGWTDHQTLDIYTEMKRLTLQIASKSLFSASLSDQTRLVSQALHVVLEEFNARMNTGLLIPDSIPTPGNLRLNRAVRRLESIVYQIINERRTENVDHGDLLSMLLNARDVVGRLMTERELRDEVLTLIIAGHDTTALALSWTFYLLATNPEVEATLSAELQTQLCGRPPTANDVPRLRFAEMVIKESLRLYPTAWGISRVALNDCDIGGYFIPARSSVVISQWVTQRDPRYFEAPLDFEPLRWEAEQTKPFPKFAYFPFGGGPRRCIGHAFAMMETILILAAVAQRFQFRLVPNQVIEPTPSFTLYPKNGIKAVAIKHGVSQDMPHK
jgi:cytochrome P450